MPTRIKQTFSLVLAANDYSADTNIHVGHSTIHISEFSPRFQKWNDPPTSELWNVLVHVSYLATCTTCERVLASLSSINCLEHGDQHHHLVLPGTLGCAMPQTPHCAEAGLNTQGGGDNRDHSLSRYRSLEHLNFIPHLKQFHSHFYHIPDEII